uniref:Uncharacterized protein n=1 Tax=Cyanistes caeruleus TaxID=156563 RepID=A0A8C0U4L6_CYACU
MLTAVLNCLFDSLSQMLRTFWNPAWNPAWNTPGDTWGHLGTPQGHLGVLGVPGVGGIPCRGCPQIVGGVPMSWGCP